jgi:hydrogenase nickel incorporation protein HypA/HybF
MHEFSIAESILTAVRKELTGHPGARPTRIGLRIGELASVNADSLKFCFDSINAGTDWEKVALDVCVCPARRICIDCGHEFVMQDYNPICPACSSQLTDLEGGDELEFDYLEVETDGTPAAQSQSTQ